MKIKANRLIWLTLAIIFFAINGCSNKSNDSKSDDGNNAIYYWRTTFRLNQYERDFLQKHKIKKMYMKFFDVEETYDYEDNYEDNCKPVGTTIFIDDVPSDIEIVPTVFITPDAIPHYSKFIDKLFKRVCDMAEVNGIKFSEIQIDCDWTESTAKDYFAFMKEFKTMLEPKGIELSATIRLFQLDYEAPAADYGVLMCYNTGDINEWETDNSILDIKDVKPYLNKLSKYKLPLSVALPFFSWDISFGEEKYMLGIEYDKFDLSNKSRFKKISDNRYEMLTDDGGYWTPKYIRHEEVKLDEILEAKKLILDKLSSDNTPIVMYHLDSINLSKLSDDDVEKIYR